MRWDNAAANCLYRWASVPPMGERTAKHCPKHNRHGSGVEFTRASAAQSPSQPTTRSPKTPSNSDKLSKVSFWTTKKKVSSNDSRSLWESNCRSIVKRLPKSFLKINLAITKRKTSLTDYFPNLITLYPTSFVVYFGNLAIQPTSWF
jgi:hypothetical protein